MKTFLTTCPSSRRTVVIPVLSRRAVGEIAMERIRSEMHNRRRRESHVFFAENENCDVTERDQPVGLVRG